MKNIRLHFALIGCLLLIHATSHAGDSKSASANVDLRPNKTVNRATPRVSAPSTFPSSKSSLKDLRNRGTAVIGGPTNTFKNTAALNGTGMKRKP
ncbi:MAG TPA: hypothetical protein VGY75_02695 [Candidatus Udaeobacter sp.]|jgi:hypothetical protein|nr:hypothetical protein [Candidatus Udaeobacter sp.]